MKPEMIPTLRKAVEWAEAEAAKDEGLWVQWLVYEPMRCGSAYCVGGYIAAQHLNVDDPYSVEACSSENGGALGYAEKLLGLTEYEAEELFCATSSIETVRRVAERIAGEAL